VGICFSLADTVKSRRARRVDRAHGGRWVAGVAVVALALITVNTISVGPGRLGGIPPGSHLPPFAAPLADGGPSGVADIARHPNDGSAGHVAACAERGPGILNICQLYERHPVVLALFVDGGGCEEILPELQQLIAQFPQVRFGAVAFNGNRAAIRRLIRRDGLTFPIAVDEGGRVASLYAMTSCPQLNFAYPGGEVESRAATDRPALAELRKRVRRLVERSHPTAGQQRARPP
jgi:hypothetical protein